MQSSSTSWKRIHAAIMHWLLKIRMCPHMWAWPHWPNIIGWLIGILYISMSTKAAHVWVNTSYTYNLLELLHYLVELILLLLLRCRIKSILKSVKSIIRVWRWTSIRCVMLERAVWFIAFLIKGAKLLGSHTRICSWARPLLRRHRNFIIFMRKVAFTSLFISASSSKFAFRFLNVSLALIIR